MNKNTSHISSQALAQKENPGFFLKLFFYSIDKIVGLEKLRNFYFKNGLAGLSKQGLSKKLLSSLGVELEGVDEFLNKVPDSGACVLVCNHPYGMVEGVILA